MRRGVCWVLAAVLAAVMLVMAMREPGTNDYERAMFADMIYGRAHRPYVARALVPTVVRTATALVPLACRQALSDYGRTKPWVRGELARLHWEPEYLTEYLLAMVVMYGALLGLVASVRMLFDELYVAPSWFRDAVSLATMLSLGLGFEYCAYIYDFATVFLFALGLLLMVRRQWGVYVGLFALACLNKETTILLTLVFAVHFWRRKDIGRRHFWGLIAAQAGIWLVSRLALGYAFAANPGGTVELHLADNLWLLQHRSFHILALFVATVGLIAYRWREKPEFLRNATWVVAALVPLIAFFGMMDELRAWYEVFPIVGLLIAHTAGGLFGVEVISRQDSDRACAHGHITR